MEVAFTFVVTLLNCPLTLEYNETAMACECIIEDIVYGTRCNSNGSVIAPEGLWIGYIKDAGFGGSMASKEPPLSYVY